MSETLQTTKKQSSTDDPSEAAIIGQATLGAGQSQQLMVGLYENSFPEPLIDVDVQPKSARVQVLPVRTLQDGDYILSYTLQNLWDQACRVIVRMTPAA